MFLHRSGITLIEMVAAVAIALTLGALALPALQAILPRAERVVCIGKLRNLRVAFSEYAISGWPQIPTNIPLGSIAEQHWWLDKTQKELQLSESDWQCPTLRRKLKSIPDGKKPLIHYLPTPFSEEPNKANNWPRMPWFIEIGNAHGGGNLLIRQDGTVETAPQ